MKPARPSSAELRRPALSLWRLLRTAFVLGKGAASTASEPPVQCLSASLTTAGLWPLSDC